MSSSAHAKHNYDDPSAPPRICLNCRAPLRGPYCAQCGQHDVDYHRSFHHLTHDLLENLFHFEGKFFTSVAWLLAKPGKLTAEFNAGQRQSQLNPLRFYIFVTVLFFLGVHLLNHGHIFPFDRKKADTLSRDFQQKVATTTAAAEGLTPEQGERVGALIEKAVDAKNGQLDQKTIADIIAQVREEAARATKSDSVINEAAGSPEKKAGTKARKIQQQKDGFDFEHALKKKFDDGELTLSKMADEIERRVPTLLFIGMPVFALLLKFVYWRRGFYYIEHLIFSIHLHTWAFLVVMVSNGYFKLTALASGWFVGLFAFALFGWATWYLFRAFRVVYGQGRIKTSLKMGMLGIAYMCAIFVLTLVIIIGTLAWLVMR